MLKTLSVTNDKTIRDKLKGNEMRDKLTYNEEKLLKAAGGGNIEQVKQTLAGDDKHSAADINCMGYLDETPIFKAIRSKQMEMVNFLTEQGADLNHCAWHGKTPLMVAASVGWPEGVQYLLEKEVDVNAQTHSGVTAVAYAVDSLDVETLRLLHQYKADFQAGQATGSALLFRAIQANSTECVNPVKQFSVVKFLVSKGVKVNPISQEGFRGDTPLIMAARLGRDNLVRYFVQCGADITACNKIGMTALMEFCAGPSADDETVQLLLNKGALQEIDRGNMWGETALMFAAKSKNPNVVKCLIENGARLDVTDRTGKSAQYHIDVYQPTLLAEINEIFQKKKDERDMAELIAAKTGEELFVMTETDEMLLQQLIMMNLLIEAFKKMPYRQAKKVYIKVEKTVTLPLRKQLQNVLRENRQRE